MHIDAPVIGEQITHQNEAFVDHRDKRVGTLAPGIAVGDLFKNVGLLGEGVAAIANLDVHREVSPDIERRVDVDQLQTALLFDFVAQRPVLER